MTTTTIDNVNAIVQKYRPLALSRLRCPQLADDALQTALIACWQAGATEAAHVYTVVRWKIAQVVKSRSIRSRLHADHLTELQADSMSAADEVAIDVFGELSAARPDDVIAALAYINGDIERTGAARVAQHARLARIRQACT